MNNRDTQASAPGGGVVYAAAVCVCAAFAAGAGYLALKYLPGLLLPFLGAYLLSLGLRPLTDRLCGSRRRRGPAAALSVLTAVGLLCFAAVAGVRRGMSELESLLAQADGAGDSPLTALAEAFDRLKSVSSHLPLLRRFEQRPGFAAFSAWLDNAVGTAAERLLLRLGGWVSDAAVTLVRGLPAGLLWVTVLVMSCFYFTAMKQPPEEAVLSLLPAGLRERVSRWQRGGKRMAGRYLRAYLLLFLITFGEMLAGLMLLRKPYPLLGALLIAFVDFLPVLGTGSVLLPWALLDCLTGHIPSGLGLLALYGVSAAVRQAVEPRLVGDSLGIHPLVSLASVWVGYRLFGVTGMILAPFAVVLVKSVVGAGAAAASD